MLLNQGEEEQEELRGAGLAGAPRERGAARPAADDEVQVAV